MGSGNQKERLLTLTRVIHAPRELVFEVFNNPDHVKNWWGPDGFTNTIQHMDPRPGGKWEFIMHGPDGMDYENKYTYHEMEPGRIRYTHTTNPIFEATITMTSQGNDTLLTMTSEFESAEQLKQVIETFKADVGMHQHAQRLENYVQGLQGFPRHGTVTRDADGFRVQFVRELNHPVDVVWKALTDPRQLAKWFTDVEMDFVPGGKMTIHFRDEVKTASPGQVVRIEPNRLFEYTWEGERAEWKLTSLGKAQCRLEFTYSKMAQQWATHAPAGWHLLLDQLEDVMGGASGPYPFGGEDNERPEGKVLRTHYTELVSKLFPDLAQAAS